jgi:hypothetical protein
MINHNQIRRFSCAAIVLILVSCGGSGKGPPSNLNDACLIVQERPTWLKSMLVVQEKWNVPVSSQMATIYQESKFIGDARTPLSFQLGVIPMGRHSSAYGYSQAIDSTWKWYKRETGNHSAKRDRFSDAVDFMGWYMNVTLERNGVKLTDVRNQYLAYHDGHTGFRRKSYNRKPWLLRISKEVAARAVVYQKQLVECDL